MGGKRCTTGEISHVLAQSEAGVPIKELCRKYDLSLSSGWYQDGVHQGRTNGRTKACAVGPSRLPPTTQVAVP